jgi:hypothetical protein
MRLVDFVRVPTPFVEGVATMKRLALIAVAWACLGLVGYALAGGTVPSLMSSSGAVVKVEKDTLTFQPHVAKGEFGRNIELKLTGTSKLTLLTEEKRGGKLVPVQREIEAKDLHAKQHLAVIYTTEAKELVLLSAVAVPAPPMKK